MTHTPQGANRGPLTISLVLWFEALGLTAASWFFGACWLLPATGLCALFAGLVGGVRIPGVLAAFASSAVWFVWLAPSAATHAVTIPYGVSAMAIGALLAFLGIYFFGESEKEETSLHLRISALLTRLMITLHFTTTGILLAAVWLGGSWEWWFGTVIAAFNILFAVETTLRLVTRLYTPRTYWDQLAAPGEFWFFRWLGPKWQLPARPPMPDDVGVRLSEMWMLPMLRRMLPAFLLSVLALSWLATSLHEVSLGQSGVRQALGRWEPAALPPGLHLSLPWPLGGVRTVDTGLVREIVLGFQSDPGQPILWERAHYVNEQMSLVGGGNDFLSVSVPVLYRIGNPVDYLRTSADSESLLRIFAEQELAQLSQGRPAYEIMTVAREPMRATFHTDLQARLDEEKTGLQVTEVYLRDIHPPVSVAPSFQEVVGAMEEKEATIHDAEAYRLDGLTRAKGSATAITTNANSSATIRTEAATGQANRFLELSSVWRRAPELYQLRETFRVFDETLGGAKKAILDENAVGSIPTQIDLRRVLNPDLVDRSSPRLDTLVPAPARQTEAFDLDIEGFLRMGKGEIPAVNVTEDDPDNLLKSQQQPTQQNP